MALKRQASTAAASRPRKGAKRSKEDKKPTRFEDFEKEEAPAPSSTSGAARRREARAKALSQPAPRRLPKSHTDVRAAKKDPSAAAASAKKDRHAKTKHEFIQRKKSQALAQFKQERQQAKKVAKQSHPRLDPADVPALAPAPHDPTSAFIVVAGSYERLLYGLLGSVSRSSRPASSSVPPAASSASKGQSSNNNNNNNNNSQHSPLTVHFTPQFMFPAHVASIRTAACAGTASRWLATGGNDETIKVWDLKKKIEVGSLTGHTGTITSVHFPSRGFLITAGEDGLINVYRAREWSLLATLKGHKGPVHDVATHPSGKLALSVGKDRTVRMWDLMRGTAAASTKLPVPAEKVAWDSTGARFAVVSGASLRVYDTAMKLVGEMQTRVRWHDVKFASFPDRQGRFQEALLAAGENKLVHVLDVDHPFEQEGLPTFREVAHLAGHGNRVKGLSILPVKETEGDREEQVIPLGITASSDGLIRAFDLSHLGDLLASEGPSSGSKPETILPSGEFSTKGTRLTCLSVAGVAAESSSSTGLKHKNQVGKTPSRVKMGQTASDDEGTDEALSDEDSEGDGDEDDREDGQGKGEEGEGEGASDQSGDEEIDSEAEEDELRELQKQIDQAKKAGLLEEVSTSGGEEDGEQSDDDDDGGSGESESASESDESEPAFESAPESEGELEQESGDETD